jgi:hypothetical protein
MEKVTADLQAHFVNNENFLNFYITTTDEIKALEEENEFDTWARDKYIDLFN